MSGNPLMFFLALSLLSFGDPRAMDKNLQSLSFALDATNKSVDSIKQGMDKLNAGIQQFAQPVSPGTSPGQEPGPANDAPAPEEQAGEHVSYDNGGNIGIQPADQEKKE